MLLAPLLRSRTDCGAAAHGTHGAARGDEARRRVTAYCLLSRLTESDAQAVGAVESTQAHFCSPSRSHQTACPTI